MALLHSMYRTKGVEAANRVTNHTINLKTSQWLIHQKVRRYLLACSPALAR